MKRARTLLAALALAGAVVTGWTLVPQNAYCVNCPLNEKCYSDYGCNTFMCNLSCVPIDKMGLDKRCR